MSESVFILCEGPSEVHIINILLDNGLLKYTEDELETMEPIHIRSSKDFESEYLNVNFGQVVVYRILDSKNKGALSFKLSKAYAGKVKVINCVTSPEIEMLMIIASGEYGRYSNHFKSKMSPKQFVQQIMKISNPNTGTAIYKFFSNPKDLYDSIKEYARVTKANKDFETLAVLLK